MLTFIYALKWVLGFILLVYNDTVGHMAWLCYKRSRRFSHLAAWSRISELGHRLGSGLRTTKSWTFLPNLPPPQFISRFVHLYWVTPISKLTGALAFNDVFRGFMQCISTVTVKTGKRLLAYKEHFCFWSWLISWNFYGFCHIYCVIRCFGV